MQFTWPCRSDKFANSSTYTSTLPHKIPCLCVQFSFAFHPYVSSFLAISAKSIILVFEESKTLIFRLNFITFFPIAFASLPSSLTCLPPVIIPLPSAARPSPRWTSCSPRRTLRSSPPSRGCATRSPAISPSSIRCRRMRRLPSQVYCILILLSAIIILDYFSILRRLHGGVCI